MHSLPIVLAGALLAGLSATVVTAPRAVAADATASAASVETLANAIRANRRALVSVNLDLSSEEAARFWPLYDRYQAEIAAIGDRVVKLIDDYVAQVDTLGDAAALQLMTDYLTAEAERLQVRRTYLPEFAKILPGRTVARFYQIENKMDAVVRYELAATIPVVPGDAPAAPPR